VRNEFLQSCIHRRRSSFIIHRDGIRLILSDGTSREETLSHLLKFGYNRRREDLGKVVMKSDLFGRLDVDRLAQGI
jgi:hypothetical protein